MKKILYLLTLTLFIGLSTNTNAQDVYGCMDEEALNYNPLATIDNGSCIYYCDSTGSYFMFTFQSDTLITVQSFAYSIGDPISYFWDFGDGTTSSLATPMHVYTEAGVYDVCFTITAQGLDSNMICSSTYCDSLVTGEETIFIVTEPVYGCTDPSATNYDPQATINDGSCIYSTDVYGCMDPLALNYNPLASIDDGSCYYDTTIIEVLGCTDTMALNYNPLATIDDGSCVYSTDSTDVYGCTDPTAINYNPLATIDDGSCYYPIDSNAVFGCTDTSALNYNPLATVDDGSCFYYCDSIVASFFVFNVDEDNGIITIVNNSPYTPPGTTYYWDFGDSTYSSEAYPSHEYEVSGFYNVCLTLTSPAPTGGAICTNTFCLTIGIQLFGGQMTDGMTLNVISETATGISEKDKEFKDVKIYPNPANNSLTLSYTLDKQENLTTTIYDLSGRIISTRSENSPAGYHNELIDISDLPSGMYQLELRNNSTRSIIRFQVIK